MEIWSYFDLLYSNSICKQSSIPTSILIGEFTSGYDERVWTTSSTSRAMSVNLLEIVTRRKYLNNLCLAERLNSIHKPQSNIGPGVGFIRLLNIYKFERVTAALNQISWTSKIFDKWCKFMMVSPILIQFNFTNKLDFDSLMFQFHTWFLQCNIYL